MLEFLFNVHIYVVISQTNVSAGLLMLVRCGLGELVYLYG